MTVFFIITLHYLRFRIFIWAKRNLYIGIQPQVPCRMSFVRSMWRTLCWWPTRRSNLPFPRFIRLVSLWNLQALRRLLPSWMTKYQISMTRMWWSFSAEETLAKTSFATSSTKLTQKFIMSKHIMNNNFIQNFSFCVHKCNKIIQG